MRGPRTLCSIRVYNPGSGSGGGGTVNTDGVTITGDGSSGNKIAILAVQTDATLTGAGTVASPLSAAQQTPTGWPVAFYTFPGPTLTDNDSITANTLNVFGIGIGYAVRATKLTVEVVATDAVGLYDIGYYNAAGTRVGHIGAQTLPSSAVQTFNFAGGAFTMNPGVYFFAWTGNANTATIKSGTTFGGGSHGPAILSYNTGYSTSASGVLPASITPPANAPTNKGPIFMIS